MLTAGILVFRLCLWKWPKYNSPISLRAEWFRSELNTFPLQECKATKCHTSALKAGWWIGNRVATAAVSPGFSGVVTHSQTFSPLKKKNIKSFQLRTVSILSFHLQKVSPSRGLSRGLATLKVSKWDYQKACSSSLICVLFSSGRGPYLLLRESFVRKCTYAGDLLKERSWNLKECAAVQSRQPVSSAASAESINQLLFH